MTKATIDRVSLDKTCGNCIGYKEGWCQIHQHSTLSITYGCRTHLTKEAYENRIKEVDRKLNSEKATRVNYMLTLMYTFLNAGLTLMTRSESALGELIGGKDWRFERKKAIKRMMLDIEEVRICMRDTLNRNTCIDTDTDYKRCISRAYRDILESELDG